MGTFVSQRLQLLGVPLNGPRGIEWSEVLGAAQDDELALLRTAGVARSVTKAPIDALVEIGSLYQRAPSPRETVFVDSYRARLGGAWAFWEMAPTTTGLASLVAPYSIGPAFCLNAAAVGLPRSSECIFVWPSPMPADDAWDANDVAAGPPLWDDGGLWDVEFAPSTPYSDLGFSVADLDWLRREVRLCKGGQAYPVAIVVGLGFDSQGATCLWDDGTVWDDGGVWDDPVTAGLFTIWPLGHTWDEETNVYGPGCWDDGDGVLWDDGTTEAFAPPSGGW